MSMFTVVTTLFLPLTFFTSYFALEPGKLFVTQSTGWKFWAVAAPVTFIFTMATLYIVLMKKYRSGEYKSDGWLRRTFFPNINTSNTNPV
ncbi:hypothetical protein K440DRAFT_618894 [Wilcoxina mikolae CBS 423.85]|nr:hypothetical protein K440DRAFT_618894 [Wilcoxina mikolae CBS 423.85]